MPASNVTPFQAAMVALTENDVWAIVQLAALTEMYFDHDDEPDGSAYREAMAAFPGQQDARGVLLGIAATLA